MVSHNKKKTDDIHHELILMQTAQMIQHLFEIHILKLKLQDSMEQTERGFSLYVKD